MAARPRTIDPVRANETDPVEEATSGSVVVRGVVVRSDGETTLSGCVVRAVDRSTRVVERSESVNPAGAFEFVLDVDQSGKSLLLVASSREWVSHPRRIDLGPGGATERWIKLELVPGCRVIGRVVDVEGRAVPGATCLLTQLSQSTRYREIPRRFSVDARRTIDMRLLADDAGVVRTTVREGRFELRASADGQTFGIPVRRRAAVGRIDVGSLRVPAATVQLTLAAVDQHGRPLRDIGVRLSDRTLCFDNVDEKGIVGAHLTTSSNGRVSFPVDEAHLPLRGAAGSREYYCRGVVWNRTTLDVRAVLVRRPHVDIVMRSPTGEVVPIDVNWLVQPLGPPIPDPTTEAEITPLSILKMLYAVSRDHHVRPGGRRVTLGGPGSYLFRAVAPGGLLLETRATVTTGDMELPVTVADVRRVRIALRNLPPRTIELEIRAQGDASSATIVRARPPDAEIVCWFPSSVKTLEVRCEEPWGAWTYDAIAELELDLASSRTNCTIQLGDGSDQVLLRVGSRKILRINVGSDGFVKLRLKPGSYRVARPGAAWRRFEIRAEEVVRVLVPRE